MILPQVISLSETKKKQKTISALYLARPFALSEYEIFKKNKKMKGKMLKQNIWNAETEYKNGTATGR